MGRVILCITIKKKLYILSFLTYILKTLINICLKIKSTNENNDLWRAIYKRLVYRYTLVPYMRVKVTNQVLGYV